jgi:hypothetical protein
VVGPGILSASLKFPWSSLWQKYCERKSSWVQMMFAPRRAASLGEGERLLQVGRRIAEQACWREARA